MTDWVAQGEWMPFTTVTLVSGDGALGTELSARTGLGRLAVVDDMRIDVWEPPTRCEVEHTGRVVRGRGIFEIRPIGPQRCRMTWTEQVDGVLARLGAVPARLGLRVALRRFARRLASSERTG
jgi:hypothetical protein